MLQFSISYIWLGTYSRIESRFYKITCGGIVKEMLRIVFALFYWLVEDTPTFISCVAY